MAYSPFSREKLLECLNDRDGFQTRFKQFRQRFAEVDMVYIRGTIDTVRDILMGTAAAPLQRLHAVRALKEGFQSYEYAFLVLLEVELLPILKCIALYRKSDRDDNRGSAYFAELYRVAPTKELESLGASFLRLILESISVWARIKRYYCLQDCEIQDIDSEYAVVYKELQQEGVAFPRSFVYYKETEFDSMKHQYYERLNRIGENRERYLSYYEQILRSGLLSERSYIGQDMQLLIRLCRSGDCYLVAVSLKVIEETIMNDSRPLPKLLALKLLNELFKAGEFEAIQFSKKLTPLLIEQIDKIEGKDLSLRRGSKMFGGEDGAKYGRIYYGQVLKSIVLWSQAIVRDPFRITKSNHESQFVKASRYLRQTKKYEMPVVSEEDIAAYKKEVNYFLEKKEVKNEALLELHNDSGGQGRMRSSQASLPIQVSASIKKSNVNRHVVPSIGQQSIEQQLATVRSLLSQFRNLNGDTDENRKWVASTLNYLRDFTNTFEEAVIQASNFDDVYGEGIQLLEKSEEVVRLHDTWRKSEQPFERMVESVQEYLAGFTGLGRSNGSKIKMPAVASTFKPTASQSLSTERPKLEGEHKQTRSAIKNSPQLSAIQQPQQQAVISQPYQNEYFTMELPVPPVIPLPPQNSIVRDPSKTSEKGASFHSARSKLYDSSLSIHEQLKIEDSPTNINPQHAQIQDRSISFNSNFNPSAIEESLPLNEQKLEDLRRMQSELRKQEVARLKEINERSIRQSSAGSFNSFHSERSNLFKQKEQLKAECQAVMLIADAMASNPPPAIPEVSPESPLPQTQQQSTPASKFGLNMPSVIKDYGIRPDEAAGHSIAERANGFANEAVTNLQSRLRKKKLTLVSCEVANSTRNDKLVPSGHRQNVLDSSVSLMHNKERRAASNEPSLRSSAKPSLMEEKNAHYFITTQKAPSNIVVNADYIRIHRESRPATEQYLPILINGVPQRQPTVQIQSQPNSFIEEPRIQPAENSYHELMPPSKLLIQTNPTFKAALEAQPVIPTVMRTDRYWMEQNLRTLAKVNSVDVMWKRRNGEHRQNSPSFPEVLAERASQHNRQVDVLSTLYKRKFQQLQQSVKRLEKDLEERDRLVSEKQSQINSLRSGMSQHNHTVMSMVRDEIDENGFNRISPTNCLVSAQTPFYGMSLDPPGVSFNYVAYLSALQGIQGHRRKRSMLKNKDIIYKDKQLEVGVIVAKDTEVKVALYFQSDAEINELSVRLQKTSPWMRLRVQPQLPLRLFPKKQYKCTICFSLPDIIHLLYEIPALVIRFKPPYSPAEETVTLPLPITFNHCVSFREPTSHEEMQHYFKEKMLSTPDFEYSTRILKDPRQVQVYFPKLVLLPCEVGLKYGMMFSYKFITGALVFWFDGAGRVRIKGCGRGAIEGEASRTIESLLTTLMVLFGREHDSAK